MVDKIKGILKKHKYAIFIFVFFIVYNFVIVGNFSFTEIDNFCYQFYIVDFSIGFCPALLPGAIYNALIPTTRADIVNLYVNILYHLFLLAVSFMLEKFLYKFNSKNRFIAFIIVLFFITGPATFSIHIVQKGMLDTYWLFFTSIFLIMVQNKYLKWFVPTIFVLSVFIHVGAMISFIPFFALIVLLEASRNEKVSKSYMIIFAISCLLAIALFIFFIAFWENNLFISREDFRELISERNNSEWATDYYYYDFVLFRTLPDHYNIQMESIASNGDSNFLIQVFGAFWLQVKATFSVFPEIDRQYFMDFANDFLVSMPIIVFLYKFVLSFFKKERENKLRRFVWFCALCLLPFAFMTSILCSVDLIQWFGHGVICLFTLVIYELYKSSDNDHLEILNKHINASSFFAIFIYFVFYMMCIVEPYT